MLNANSKKKYDRVCLIIPPSIFLLDERVFVNLGILRVAAVLEKLHYPIDVLDLSGIENYEEVVKKYINSNKDVRIFGLTATTPQMPSVKKIVMVVRNESKNAKTILGGPHPTLVHSAYKNELKRCGVQRARSAMENLKKLFDVIVSGDGEEAIFLAIQAGYSGVIDANDRNSEMFLTNKNLEELPFPARHLVDLKSYRYSIDKFPAASLIAQLGCPFECGFCGGRQAPMLRVIRTRSADSIIREMRHLYQKHGYTGFMFYDDELNVNPKMTQLMHAITKLQKELSVEFRLRGFIKAELFNEMQANAMYRAGFRWILTGFESGSPRILKNINKKATKEENESAIQIARKAGLKVKALMSIGHPGESEQTVRDTHEWLLAVKPDDFDVTIVTTYPGTPYYDFAEKNAAKEGIWTYVYQKTGDRLHSYEVDYNEIADYYKGIPNGGYRSYVYTDYLSAEELVKWRDFIENDVKKKLAIPFNTSFPSIRYEHSMGQFGPILPSSIFRRSDPT